jgi:hypothetical protein
MDCVSLLSQNLVSTRASSVPPAFSQIQTASPTTLVMAVSHTMYGCRHDGDGYLPICYFYICTTAELDNSVNT